MATSVKVNHRLLASFRDEPKRILKPIHGYEEEMLLPLKEACRPLEKILGKELRQNIIISSINSIGCNKELTRCESSSIYLYTMEWSIPENSLYAVLNRTLRLSDRKKLRPWFRYLKLFLTAFYKLPPSEYKTVWRGVREDLTALYSRGKEKTWWSFNSCTSSINVLQSPFYLGNSKTQTIFSIETYSGKFINAHSSFEEEDEILLLPGTCFKVIDVSYSAQGLHTIHLCEIPSFCPVIVEPFPLRQLNQALSRLKTSSPPSTSHSSENNQEYMPQLNTSISITPKKGRLSNLCTK
ncbi:unnamed protein product [Adineta steineri]|uniref:NAD(P)(+)--arginine ADP-ribosyltransferase n=1 Tax=Adineta steineri TaxID=433720 RepID=A0A815A2V8_9BILA|nr:unnamed protein product [Adineta steineri]CAF1537956.1 unnamed protein product [Adineta steineri]